MIGKPQYIQVGEHTYETPPMPPFEKMVNFGVPVEEQKFNRTKRPLCFSEEQIERDDDGYPMWNNEQSAFIYQEYKRRIEGEWYLIHGKPIYITGDHYFFLNYWWMNADTDDGYPEFRYANVKYFYFADIIDKSETVFGGQYVTQRRDGKTERELSRIYNKATLNSKVFCSLMSLDLDHCKENMFNKIVRSWKEMFEPFRPRHSGTTEPRDILMFGNPPKKSKKSKEEQRKREVLDSYINPLPTKSSALQGKRPFYTFIDEAATIDGMNLIDFWGVSKQALALGMKKIVGKVMLPCTLEEMKEKAGERYYKIWKQSGRDTISANGRTQSGLIRYLKPYWEGLEGFVDEYGFDKEEEAKAYVEAEIESADTSERIRLRRQFPRSDKDAFNISFGASLEDDVLAILDDTLAVAESGVHPMQPCEIYEIGGDVKIRNVKPSEECLWILEEPREGVEYIIGMDGSATDKDSGGEETVNKRSKFAIVVTKKLEIGARSYCDVAIVSKVPKSREDMFRIAYQLWVYYNTYGKCKIMAEANAGVASPLQTYFTNRGARRALMAEPKYVGTDSKDVLKRTGFVRTGTMKRTQIDLVNIAIRLHGHHLRSPTLIRSLMSLGSANADEADAFLAALVAWGNFGNVEMRREIRTKGYMERRGERYFDQQKGVWVTPQSLVPDEVEEDD